MDHTVFFNFMRDLKKNIVPYKCPYNKIRIGNYADGGYVIADLPCNICYSYGSNDEISFEVGLYEKYKAKSYVFDHTIENITNKPDFIFFSKEGVSHVKTHDCDTIDNHVIKHDTSENMLLKMDVEFSEWDVLLNCNSIDKFSQIVVEFHFYSLIPDVMIKVFKKITEKFKIIHLHANPHQINPYIDVEFPRVIEITFLRNDYFMNGFEVDMTSNFPDLELDPVYAIPFRSMNWWRRQYDTSGIQLLRDVKFD